MSVVVVGTGLAGYMFAKEFRKRQAESPLILITKSDGYFYSKPLLSTALMNHKTPDELWINDVDAMRHQLNADIHTRCTVFKIDADHKKIFFRDEKNKEHELFYHQLILASGAEPIAIPLKGDAVDDVLSVNQLEDYRIFHEKLKDKKRVAILGVGLVGCEFANDLVSAGYSVTLIAPDNYVLKKWAPEMIGRALESALQKAGVDFHLSVFPNEINKKNSHYEIILSNHKKIEADFILSATGIKPHLSLAQSAHLKTHIGVVTNAHLQTSDPHIFALGDCVEVNGEMTMYVAPILHSARILAQVLSGEMPPIQNPVMPIVIKTSVCPVVVVTPPKNSVGEWIGHSDGANVQALFYDDKRQLRGFALSGNCVKEKMQLIKQIGHSP